MTYIALRRWYQHLPGNRLPLATYARHCSGSREPIPVYIYKLVHTMGVSGCTWRVGATKERKEVGMRRLVGFSLACLGFIALIMLVVLVMGGFELLSGVGVHGWIAFTLGVVLTSALGVALMALVFHSDRSGQDERAGGGGPNSDR
jgi:hypothetical protein